MGAFKRVSRTLERSLHRKPRYSPPIGKNIRGVDTFSHAITELLGGVESIHPPMSITPIRCMNISFISYYAYMEVFITLIRVIMIIEFLLTFSPITMREVIRA